MRILVTLLLILSLTPADIPLKYQDYIDLWKKKAPKDAIFSLKQYSSENELCDESQCELFYFVVPNQIFANQEHSNRTVLLVSGLRGDDITGPTILLNLYGRLKAARTIFLPLANPSGYSKGTVQTYPGKINIQNDFPVGNRTQCNQTAAAKGLDYIYRNYNIDLTIYIHDGKPAISYSWGKEYDSYSKTQDFGIYTDIADMVRYYGNNQKQLKELEAGPIYQLKQTGNVGNFIDWAYGGSKYPSIISKKCGEQNLDPYPYSMFNGLAFSLAIGKIKGDSSSIADKEVSRSMILIEKIVKITHPRMNVGVNAKNISLLLEGCKIGTVRNIKILTEDNNIFIEKQIETSVKGDVTFGLPSPTFIDLELPKNFILPDTVRLELTFECDNGWINVGKTAFSKLRAFYQKQLIKMAKVQQKNQPKSPSIVVVDPKSKDLTSISSQQTSQNQWSIYMIVIIVLGLLLLGWIINGVRLSLKVQHTQRIKNFDEKFQIVEVVDDVESFQNNFGEKETPQLTEAKQGQHQDADHSKLNPT